MLNSRTSMDRIQFLSQFNLMNSLSREDLIEMDKLTIITTFPKQALIQTPDSNTESLYFVKRGKVRLYRINGEGKPFTLDILGEGNIFGDMKDISLGTKDLFIEAVEESDICVMNQDRFESYLISHPHFMLNLIKAMSDRLSHLSSLAQNLALGNLHDRIIYILVDLSKRLGVQTVDDGYSRIKMNLSHQEISSLVGASREAVSVALKELAELGAIRTGFRTVAIRHDLLVPERN